VARVFAYVCSKELTGDLTSFLQEEVLSIDDSDDESDSHLIGSADEDDEDNGRCERFCRAIWISAHNVLLNHWILFE